MSSEKPAHREKRAQGGSHRAKRAPEGSYRENKKRMPSCKGHAGTGKLSLASGDALRRAEGEDSR